MKPKFPWKKVIQVGRRVKLAGVLGPLLALLLITSVATYALALPPQPPHWCRGSIYIDNVAGDPVVPPDTSVTTLVDSLPGASTTADNLGRYGYSPLFSVPYPGPGSYEIIFFVHDIQAHLYDIDGGGWTADPPDFASGAHTEVDLMINDNIPPSVTIDELTPDPTNDNTPTFSGTATDTLCNVTNVNYRVDGGVWMGTTPVDGTFDELTEEYTFTIPVLPDGTHTVEVRAFDAAANETAEVDYASDTFTVDTQPPTTVLDPITPDPTNDNTPTLTGTATDNPSWIASVQYRVDGGPWLDAPADDGDFDEISESFTVNLGPLADGPHTVEAKATDAAGNESSVASDTFTIDTQAPSVTIDALVPDPTADDTPTFTGTATDNPTSIASVEYRVDSGVWAAATALDGTFDEVSEAYTFTTPVLADGPHTVEAKATDAAGNTTAEVDYASDEFTVSTALVLINEFVVQGLEWIELYNPSGGAADLTGWTIEDGNAVPEALDGLSIPAGDYLVLEQGTDFDFVLGDAGDTIILKDDGATEVDKVAYGDYADGNTADNAPVPGAGESTGRCPDGSDTDVDDVDFVVFVTPTPEAENAADPAVTTLPATDITNDSATLNGSLDDLGCPPAEVDVSFEWGIVSGALDQETIPVSMADTGAFFAELDFLAPDNTYYFRAKADGTTVYGAELSFTTLAGPALITIDLDEEWNIFSTPFNLDPDYDTWGELATAAGLNWTIAWSYNGQTNEWVQVLGDYVLTACDAIYVYMNTAGSVPIYPTPGLSVSSKEVHTGWNLVGSAFYNLAGELPVNEALISLYYAEGELLPWGYSQVISPELNQPEWVYVRDGIVQNMLVGKGYWVAMENDDTYLGQTSTPYTP